MHLNHLGQKILGRGGDQKADRGRSSRNVVEQTDLGVRFRADSAAFRATLRHGSEPVDGWVRVEECALSWGYPSPVNPQTLFRYRSHVERGTRRMEAGERSDDGGRTWWAFYGAETTGPAVSGC